MLALLLLVLAVEPDVSAPAVDEQSTEDEALRQREAQTRKRCGRDFHRIRVGMTWARVKQCAGFDPMEWTIAAEDQRGTVYTVEGGYVRVEAGKVVKWVAPRQ